MPGGIWILFSIFFTSLALAIQSNEPQGNLQESFTSKLPSGPPTSFRSWNIPQQPPPAAFIREDFNAEWRKFVAKSPSSPTMPPAFNYALVHKPSDTGTNSAIATDRATMTTATTTATAVTTTATPAATTPTGPAKIDKGIGLIEATAEVHGHRNMLFRHPRFTQQLPIAAPEIFYAGAPPSSMSTAALTSRLQAALYFPNNFLELNVQCAMCQYYVEQVADFIISRTEEIEATANAAAAAAAAAPTTTTTTTTATTATPATPTQFLQIGEIVTRRYVSTLQSSKPMMPPGHFGDVRVGHDHNTQIEMEYSRLRHRRREPEPYLSERFAQASTGVSSDSGVVWGGMEKEAALADATPDQLRHVPFPSRINPQDAEAKRNQYEQIYYAVYSDFWFLCRERAPARYINYCKGLLKGYPMVMQGLHWGDRPETVCLRMQFCPTGSYLATETHSFDTGVPQITSETVQLVTNQNTPPTHA